jgi:two-component system, NtrC family, response regulator AtoC
LNRTSAPDPEMGTAKSRVLVVEDDDDLRELLTDELDGLGVEVRSVASAEAALEVLDEAPQDLVVSDLRLPGLDGLDLLRRVHALPDRPGFLLITAFGTIDEAVAALKEGADDFLTKPLNLEHLSVRVLRILDHQRLRMEMGRYREAMGEDAFHGMVGRSPAMRRLRRQIQQVSLGHGHVLIQGESGVGKELVARAIHAESSRSRDPFRAVNCAGVPETLLESEFFGHVRGAFTGASRARSGIFQSANGGTVLLDEIGEMPLPLQAKLLRVLQEGRVRPVGSDADVEVDVRVLASTNRDLARLVEEGAFREDLSFRLDTFSIDVPPLRERPEDIDLLAVHFIRRHALRLDRPPPTPTPAVLDRLREYAFPGNVRELENTLERAVTFCEGGEIEERHLSERLQAGSVGVASPSIVSPTPDAVWHAFRRSGEELPTLRELDAWYVRMVLELSDGNKRQAARRLGISRRTLYRRLDEDAPS